MSRRRRGHYGAIPTEPTTIRRSFPLTTLLSLSITFAIFTTLMGPAILNHRRQFQDLVTSFTHRDGAPVQNRQNPNQKETAVLHTATRILQAVNASLIPKSATRLRSYKRTPVITREGIGRNNMSATLEVKNESSRSLPKSSQEAIFQGPRGSMSHKASGSQKDRHSLARIQRNQWWSLLHRRVHPKNHKTQIRFAIAADQDKEPVKKAPSLGRQNVVRDHIGRIVESDSDAGSDFTGGFKGTLVATTSRGNVVDGLVSKKSTQTSSVTVVQGNNRDGNGEKDEDDEDDAATEEVDDEKDSTNATDTSRGKRRTVDKNEFMGSLGGTVDGMVRGQNVTKLSVTLFKIMKLFGFSSLTDSPAGAHAEWMGDVARRLTFEQPLFRYVGVDKTPEGLKKAKESVGDDVDGEFEIHDVEHELGKPTDVLFHWTELDGSPQDAHHSGYLMHVRMVLQAARRAGHGHVIFPQLPRLRGVTPSYRHGKWSFIDDKEEEPFLFNDHVRGAVPVGNGSRADVVYLTFYSTRAIPEAQLDV